jgi:hypothetical protein
MFATRTIDHAKSLIQTFAIGIVKLLPFWDTATQETMSILMSNNQFDMVMLSLQEIKKGEVVTAEDVFADLMD